MAALAVATAGLTAASSLQMVALLRGVQGLLAASFAAVALAYVGEALPPRWRSTGIGAISTAFLVAGILGQVYAQAVAQAVSWRWVFGLAAPAFAVAALAIGTVLFEPARAGPAASLGQKYQELAALAVRRELALPYAACVPVLLSFVAMYTSLGPLLQTQYGLADSDVLLVRLAALPAMLLAPLAGWLVGRRGPTRVAFAGYLLAAAGLAVQAISVAALWAMVVGSVVFVAGIAMIVPAVIALVGGRGGSARAGALGLTGLAVFAGASLGPLAAELPLSFTALMLVLAALLLAGAALIAQSAHSSRSAGIATARRTG
jgi:predicted MFS family arabinose efflux permease